jgi:two-component system, chemotaxis family, sensor histidine kinase and response regulator WspE
VSADLSMLDLFRLEAEGQGQALVSGLLELERDHAAAEHLDACMRAAHSLKGAARIVGLDAGVAIAHALEDCFVAAQAGTIVLGQAQIDRLLEGVELLMRVAKSDEHEVEQWETSRSGEVEACRAALLTVLEPNAAERAPVAPAPAGTPAALGSVPPLSGEERVVRVTAESFNRLFGLASEALIKGRWVGPFTQSLAPLKRLHEEAARTVDRLRDQLPAAAGEPAAAALADLQRQLSECQQLLADRLVSIDWFDRRAQNGLQRLYDEALACRMRPFRDGTQALPLLVRTVARSLDKRVTLLIEGEGTQVDRDLLGRLDAPLGHLLRNAIDHGIESPEERRAAGKPDEGTLRLEARHSAGRLHITLSDDGRGVDFDRLRTRIVERKLINAEAAQALSEAELLEFLFLPAFTLKDTVSDISGRGVGLDAVRDMVTQVRGTVRVSTTRGAGTQFRLQLPVTLSVLRALIVEVAGEPYAFPLSAVTRVLQLSHERVARLEGRRHFELEGRRVGLVPAHQVLGMREPAGAAASHAVVVVGEGAQSCGIIVDRFLGERELVVQPLDPLLGKIKDIAAGALLDDGSPVLIVDVEDLLRSVAKLASEGRLAVAEPASATATAAGAPRGRKRVLVVDDSLTVRELERKVLVHHGYDVEVAVDGMDGWNAVRGGGFDLVVTDVDMPRMDGIELVSLITRDPQLRATPVMIVSYKDREEDRRRGLEAGAAYYLTKGSFQDDTLVQAVVDLIGEARP